MPRDERIGAKTFSGLAYFISGSELIKASIFESLGDVMSSAILAVTQMLGDALGRVGRCFSQEIHRGDKWILAFRRISTWLFSWKTRRTFKIEV